MLLQFTVENFLSFDEPTNFSMRAGKDKDHLEHLIQVGKETATKGAAIYGANAAGKSNLVLAMGFARDLIVGKSGVALSDVRPFRLNAREERASGFHWQFVHAGKLWSYGFDATKTAVVAEYLFARDTQSGKEKRWFERATDVQGATKVKLGAEFVSAITRDDAQLLKLKAPRLDANALFLREILAEKIEAIEPVFQWFEDVLLIVRAETVYDPLIIEAGQNKAFRHFISNHLKGAGAGISKIALYSRDIEDSDFEQAPEEFRDYLQDIKEQIAQGKQISVFNNEKNVRMVFRADETGNMKADTLNAVRVTSGGREEVFDLWEESEGTQRFIHLLPHFYRLQTRPTVLVIDEFERRLHTLLTQRLLRSAFDSPQQNNQFIFTTHDTNLLDSALLRRDEIWFVDKNERGASSLVSLVEFKIRSDANYEKGYLLGAFDGIPYFGSSGSTALTEAK